MGCEQQTAAFENRLEEVQLALNAELAAITAQTEARATEIANDLEADNDLAAGVGAVAGSTVGGLLGGTAGVLIGGAIGRTIGSLFTLEIATYRQTVSLDVPQTAMRTRSFSYDLPVVEISDQDMSFDVPTTVMQRQKGPPRPHTRTEWRLKCVGRKPFRVCTKVPQVTVWWEDTWIDVPVIEMRTQRIVLGIPQVRMERQEIRLDVPEISMRPTSMSVDVPSLTLRFVKDAGRRTAAAAAALAQSAQEAVAERQIAYRGRLQTEVAPFAIAMFACHREELIGARSQVMDQFASQIGTLTATVTSMISRQVPENSTELRGARQALDEAIRKRDEAIAQFDQALSDLDAAAKQAMDQFLGDETVSLVDKGMEEGDQFSSALVAFTAPH